MRPYTFEIMQHAAYINYTCTYTTLAHFGQAMAMLGAQVKLNERMLTAPLALPLLWDTPFLVYGSKPAASGHNQNELALKD